MSLIRHAIIDTTTNKIINIIDYEETQTGVPPGLESHLLCIANDTYQIGGTLVNNVYTPPQPYPSWTLVNNVWTPPVSQPTATWSVWNESSKSWTIITP